MQIKPRGAERRIVGAMNGLGPLARCSAIGGALAAFVALTPLSVTFASKLLFGAALGWTLLRKCSA